jgi:probable F420-dependent oxidoreductase
VTLRVGIDVPYLAGAGDVRTYVTAIESAGYGFLGFSEHVCSTTDTEFPAPMFTFEEPWRETVSFAGFLAGITQRIELNPAMMLLPLYHPVLAAKQLAEIENLSGGRLRVAASIGWNPRETESLGVDPTTRGARFEEQVSIMRRLWSEQSVDHSGQFFELRGVGISARPQQVIPLWFGAGKVGGAMFPSDVAVRRAAEHADGFKFLAPSFLQRDEVARSIERLQDACATAGRDPSAFGIEVRMPMQMTTPSEWRSVITWAKSLGATHFGVSNRVTGAPLGDQIATAERFAAATADLW